MVMDHYLIVKKWKPNFDPWNDNTENILVWVRFPTLSIEYYTHEKIGNKIGKTIKMDYATSLVSRGKFARLCVEVDITKPLLSKFDLTDKVCKIEYEGLYLVCFKCGKYGHRDEGCPMNIPEKGEEGEQSPTEDGDNGRTSTLETNRVECQTKHVRQAPEMTEPFGPWMLAARNPRRGRGGYGKSMGNGRGEAQKSDNSDKSKANTPQPKPKDNHGNSRFSVLEIEGENDDETQDNMEIPIENGPSASGKLPSKGKRPICQINEKQLRTSTPQGDEMRKNQSDSTEKQNKTEGSTSRSKKAATQEEHTVVRGSNKNGNHTSNTIICHNNDESPIVFHINEDGEHHGDPPDTMHVIMDEDLPSASNGDPIGSSPEDAMEV